MFFIPCFYLVNQNNTDPLRKLEKLIWFLTKKHFNINVWTKNKGSANTRDLYKINNFASLKTLEYK